MSSLPKRTEMTEKESHVWEAMVTAIADFYRMNGRFKNIDGHLIMQFPPSVDPFELGPDGPLDIPLPIHWFN